MNFSTGEIGAILLVIGIGFFRSNSNYLNCVLIYILCLQAALSLTFRTGVTNSWVINVDYILISGILLGGMLAEDRPKFRKRSEIIIWLMTILFVFGFLLFSGINSINPLYRISGHLLVVMSSIRLGLFIISKQPQAFFVSEKFWIATGHFLFFTLSITITSFKTFSVNSNYHQLLSFQNVLLSVAGIILNLTLLIPIFISWKRRL